MSNDLQRLLRSALPAELSPHEPVATLLAALEGHPALAWMLKDAPTLSYRQWEGELPMGDPRVSIGPPLAAGQTDLQHFEPVQASVLRLADQRVLRNGRPGFEVHRLEARQLDDPEPTREWRVWRVGFTPPGGEPSLLTVWLDQGLPARHEQALALARRQIQEQQLVLAQLAARVPLADAPPGVGDFLQWSAQRFEEQLLREVDLSRREHRSFALILLELDTHAADAVSLQAQCALLAQQLAAGTRRMDTVAQVAPRRFAVLLSGAALTPAYVRAEALRRQCAAQVALPLQALSQQQAQADGRLAHAMSLSAGVAAYPHTTREAAELMHSALLALQEAQQAGGNRTVMSRVNLPPAPP